MQTRTMRACGIAAVGLLAALATSGVSADTPNTPRPETSLLGVRLMASFSDVMRKFGQPNEIQVGEPTVSANGQTASAGPMGGGPRMGGMMGGPGMGMTSSSMGGYPGGPGGMTSSPGGGYMNMALRGGASGGMGMMGSSMGSGGYPGGPGGGGLPGLGGRPGGMTGGMMGGMAPGNAGAGASESGESTWWYHFPQKGLHYSFLFNKDGRVIQIQAYGQKPDPKIVAPRTAQGITLGTELGQVIRRYGWSNDGEHSGDYVVMRYGKTDQVAFQMRRNKVLGIVLGRVNPQAPSPSYARGPGMGMMGGPGGYPGGGMMGRGMGMMGGGGGE